jgi:hypothetical protein
MKSWHFSGMAVIQDLEIADSPQIMSQGSFSKEGFLA